MRALFCVIFLLLTPVADLYGYELLNLEELGTTEHSIVVSKEELEIENLEVVEENPKYEQNQDTIKYWYDVYIYLSGASGLGIMAFLSRVGYVFYQTKTGKLFVKHIKNTSASIEDDIVDSINKLTDLEDGEELRRRLTAVKEQLYDIAKKNLPPKPE